MASGRPRLGLTGGAAKLPCLARLGRSATIDSACRTALDPRRVRRMVGEHAVGEVRVLVRGHPDPARELARRLRGQGVLLLARLDRGQHAYLVERRS